MVELPAGLLQLPQDLSPAGGIEAFAAPILQSELGFPPSISPVVDRAASIRAFRHVVLRPLKRGLERPLPVRLPVKWDFGRGQRDPDEGKNRIQKWVVAPGGLEPPAHGLGNRCPTSEYGRGLKDPYVQRFLFTKTADLRLLFYRLPRDQPLVDRLHVQLARLPITDLPVE